MHQKLAAALSDGEFRVYYQPMIALATGSLIGVEALLRWPQRDDTFTAPDIFIGRAEASGFIIELGDYVLRCAAEQMRAWHDRYQRPLRLAVNLSARQFLHYNLIASIKEALAATRLDPSFVELEITETVAMQDPEESIGVMRQLRDLGMSLALDDFGTGYSSLAYLKKLPIDKLKIDKSFVRDIPEDTNDLAIVNAIIPMSHALGLTVLAEGVETNAQAEFLTQCSCEFAQGYLYGRALPPEDFERLFLSPRKPALDRQP
jgi:EAL domain-containing protein (putative c-di-GMP-specific phosphodiesterase class I)